MSKLLHNHIRISTRKSPKWSCIDKRAVAFSMYSGRSLLLRRPVDTSSIQKRRYGMLVARAIRGVLKIRYLLLGGAVGGGMSLGNKYQEWKDGLPDMGWVNELLPDSNQWDKFTSSLITVKDRIGDNIQIGVPLRLSIESDPRLREAGALRASELREWIAQRYEDAVAAAQPAEKEQAPAKLVNNLMSKPAPSPSRPTVEDTSQAYEKRVRALQEEVLSLQARYQRELQRLEQENRELRQQNMLLKQGRQPHNRKVKRSLIDLYSSVLDELSPLGVADRLPRVVVVGDQSAGKTSVLEMLAQARIFPRGAGEMCTRAPVMVTLSEGPYHVAQFSDSAREFDLTKEADLAELRKEVELRMRRSVSGGRTVSREVISMAVRGPALHRVVLVDLPGVISTQTVDMASDTRESIKEMTKHYMENPNAIILCIQDGSVDAERSNVTDLVSSCDPSGKRTIFVLTKVDLAEENLADPNRIRRILEGKLFPMKALGYYAVVTGRSKKDDSIQNIQDYEEKYFRSSKLFKDGLVSASQVTTRNLSLAVAECFWRMVRATVEQQADYFKATRFNLETEWKNSFPRQRELDRDESFDRVRALLLDRAAELWSTRAEQWEAALATTLWSLLKDRLVDGLYLPAAKEAHAHPDADKFNTSVDIKLREWAQSELPALSVAAGKKALRQVFEELLKNDDDDAINVALRDEAVKQALDRHTWEDRAIDVLRVLQLNALSDRAITSRGHWDDAIQLMTDALTDKLNQNKQVMEELTGPGWKKRWLYWQSCSEDQNRRSEVKSELERLATDRPHLTYDQVVAVRDNLRRKGIEVDNEYIRETWSPVYMKFFLEGALSRARDCKKSFYLYSQQNGTGLKECCEVVMFWRVQQSLKTTATALRQQIYNREAARLDRDLREVLDEMSADPELKKALLSGRRIELAEELKRVRQIQEKLEEFIEALNKEK